MSLLVSMLQILTFSVFLDYKTNSIIFVNKYIYFKVKYDRYFFKAYYANEGTITRFTWLIRARWVRVTAADKTHPNRLSVSGS